MNCCCESRHDAKRAVCALPPHACTYLTKLTRSGASRAPRCHLEGCQQRRARKNEYAHTHSLFACYSQHQLALREKNAGGATPTGTPGGTQKHRETYAKRARSNTDTHKLEDTRAHRRRRTQTHACTRTGPKVCRLPITQTLWQVLGAKKPAHAHNRHDVLTPTPTCTTISGPNGDDAGHEGLPFRGNQRRRVTTTHKAPVLLSKGSYIVSRIVRFTYK